MSADVPHTLYLKDGGEYSSSHYSIPDTEESRKNTDEAMRKNNELVARLEAKRKAKQSEQWEKVTPEQIFNEQ